MERMEEMHENNWLCVRPTKPEIWSYRTPYMDNTLKKGQVVCYRTNRHAIVFQ